jgi:hypothetical protein
VFGKRHDDDDDREYVLFLNMPSGSSELLLVHVHAARQKDRALFDMKRNGLDNR